MTCFAATRLHCKHSCASCMQGLKELEQRTGDGRIHLRFTFKRGLHPFFPSAVQVSHFLTMIGHKHPHVSRGASRQAEH
jgi:hypothetical protein